MGEINPGVGAHTFIRDHVATVNASPADGFSHSEGDVGEENIYAPMMVIELDTIKSLTAVGTDPRRFPVVGQLPPVFTGPVDRSRWPPQRGPVPGEQGESLERSRAGPLHPRGHAAALT